MNLLIFQCFAVSGLLLLYATILKAQTQPFHGLDPAKTMTQYVHEVWQIKDGLPQNSVQSIHQTPDGYLWFSTQEGVVRFDGVRFSIYAKKNSGFPENYCNSLRVDQNGAVWVATQSQGIVRIAQGRFTVLTAKDGLSSTFTPENCNGLAVSPDNSLWIATLGGGVNRFKDGKISVYSVRQGLSSNDVQTLLLGNDTTLWIGTTNGLNRLNIRTGTIESINFYGSPAAKTTMPAVQAIAQDNRGGLWVGTLNGLYRLYNGIWTTFTSKSGLPGNHIRALLYDSKGTLWIGTVGAGLCRLTNGIFSTFSTQDGLSHTDIYGLYEDREGCLYIGTSGGGLNRLRNGSVTVYNKRPGFADPWSVMEDNTGTMWFSMFANGITAVNPQSGMVQHLNTQKGLPSNNAHAMMQDKDGSFWFGTRDKGFCHVVHGKVVRQYGIKDGLPNERVRVFLRDSKGRLWIGTDKGASCFANGSFMHFGKSKGLSDGRTPVIHEDRTGKIWIGTREGLFVLENDVVVKSYTIQSGMAGDNVIWMSADERDVMWVGTTNGGLHRIYRDSVTAYTTQNGLFDDSVFSLLEDNNGWMWMSCSKGIFRVKKSALEAIAQGTQTRIACIVYGIGDGMPSPECNGASQPAAWKSRDGRLWFPTIAGAVVINPDRLIKNIQPPTVIIEQVFADGNRIGGASPYLREEHGNQIGAKSVEADDLGRQSLKSIMLPPTTEKFEFHYTATCLTAADRVYFKYMLEGYDKDWTDAGTRRTAYYNNLTNGKLYRFRVIACNNDGIWNELGATTAFMMRPFWYETWWFYGLCGASVVISGFGLYRWRVSQLRNRAQVLEQTVLERTTDLREANNEITRQMELLSEQAREIELANSRLHELNEDLHRSNQALDEASRFKTQMLSVVSHDLKNPLTTVLVAAKYLRPKVADDSDTQELLAMIHDSVQTMSGLIVDILDQAALQLGQLELRLAPVQLEEICHELLHEYQYRANDKQQTLATEIEAVNRIDGDQSRLRQVVDNLLSNAIKYSPQDSVITVRLKQNNAKIRFEVRDQGPGLTKEDQQKLFGFFQRLSAVPTGGESSTGIGLAIVKQIVELHGGRVWCESEPGKGATFIVELPMS